MSVKDDDDNIARLPSRQTTMGTRTDTRLAPREVTSIVRPLFTADDSAEDSADDSATDFSPPPNTDPGTAEHSASDEDADLFDQSSTVAEAPALPSDPTRISDLRNAHDRLRTADESADSDSDDNDDNENNDDNDDNEERTVVSMQVPEHLLDPPGRDGFFADGDLDHQVDSDVAEPFLARSTELVTTRLPARPTRPAWTGWQLGVLVFAAVIGAALVVVVVVALLR